MSRTTQTFATIDAAIAQARTGLSIRRANKDKSGVYKFLRIIDHLLDQRLELSGPPLCGCKRPLNRYSTNALLCAECDFVECRKCGRRVISLTAQECPTCKAILPPERLLEQLWPEGVQPD